MSAAKSATRNYDEYICEYLAAYRRFDALQALLKDNPTLLNETKTPPPVWIRLQSALTRLNLMQLENARKQEKMSRKDTLSVFKECALGLDKVNSAVPSVPRPDFQILDALSMFDILFSDLYAKHHGEGNRQTLVSGVKDITQRCFRSQAVLGSVPEEIEEAITLAQLRKDEKSFSKLHEVVVKHGIVRFIAEVQKYLDEVEKQLGIPLITQIFDDIVAGRPASSQQRETILSQSPCNTQEKPAESSSKNQSLHPQEDNESSETASGGAVIVQLDDSPKEDDDNGVVPRKNHQRDVYLKSLSTAKKTKRKPFSESEIENLVKGVKKFGVGRWREILQFFEFQERSTVDLKDKWRNMEKKRRKEESSASDSRNSRSPKKRLHVTEAGVDALMKNPSTSSSKRVSTSVEPNKRPRLSDRTNSIHSIQPAAAAAVSDIEDDNEPMPNRTAPNRRSEGQNDDLSSDGFSEEEFPATQV